MRNQDTGNSELLARQHCTVPNLSPGHRENLQRAGVILRMQRECAKSWELTPGSLEPETSASPFLVSASLYPHGLRV